jgi:hypothetical protein
MERFPDSLETADTRGSNLDRSRLLVAFADAQTQEAVEELVLELGLELEDFPRARRQGTESLEINHTDRRFWLRSIDHEPIEDEQFRAIEERLIGLTDWIGPVYVLSNAHGRPDYLGPVPTVLLVLTRDEEQIQRAVEAFGMTIDEAKSKYLNDYTYLELPDARQINAFEARTELGIDNAVFELMPMIRDWCAVPNDPLFAQQWNMSQIQGPQAWDIGTGTGTTVIAVMDSGTDLTHPDLLLAGPGIDLGDMVSDGSPNDFGPQTGHGTCCSGIAAGIVDNAAGVAGVAGTCSILPLAISNFSNVEIANGLNWAVAQGATVISMSFGIPQSGLVGTALAAAFANDVVLCAATGNNDSLGILYPARNPNVMAIGASDQADDRKTATSPDGEFWWGSNFGPEVSVVAPGVRIPSTDIQGSGGYNPAAGAAGDYHMTFNGTSSATPHVAGLVGLIRSQYPTLSVAQTRALIERTADKVGAIPYSATAGYPNGTWNNEMGYGRINAFRALDNADVMIRDWPGDSGQEPSTAGNFWDFSDIVVRITDDGVFNPGNPSQSKHVERGQTNYIYVRVTNRGPREARNVAVNIRITPYVGLQFVSPADWTTTDAMHVAPTAITGSFATIPTGGEVIAKFSISATQVEDLYGWQNDHPWHPCLLAQVTADNDYAYLTSDLSFGNIVVRKNNFAQRNLTVIDVLASALVSFPFVIGSLFRQDRLLELDIDRSRMPRNAHLELRLDGNDHMFPLVDFDQRGEHPGEEWPRAGDMVFDERTRLRIPLGCCDVQLTLEKNSRMQLLCSKRPPLKVRHLRGGELRVTEGRQVIALTSPSTRIALEGEPGAIYALALRMAFPGDLEPGDEGTVAVMQFDASGAALGGATAIYRVN